MRVVIDGIGKGLNDSGNTFHELFIFKALLHFGEANFLATCLAILLEHNLHALLLCVTCPKMNMSRNFFVAAIVMRTGSWFYFV